IRSQDILHRRSAPDDFWFSGGFNRQNRRRHLDKLRQEDSRIGTAIFEHQIITRSQLSLIVSIENIDLHTGITSNINGSLTALGVDRFSDSTKWNVFLMQKRFYIED